MQLYAASVTDGYKVGQWVKRTSLEEIRARLA